MCYTSQFSHDVFREVFSLFFAKIPSYAARNGVFSVSVHHLLQLGRRLNCNYYTD